MMKNDDLDWSADKVIVKKAGSKFIFYVADEMGRITTSTNRSLDITIRKREGWASWQGTRP